MLQVPPIPLLPLLVLWLVVLVSYKGALDFTGRYGRTAWRDVY